MPLKDEHENHDILLQDTENMPKNKKLCEWYEVNDGWKWLIIWKNQMPGQYDETVQTEKKTKEERSDERGRF